MPVKKRKGVRKGFKRGAKGQGTKELLYTYKIPKEEREEITKAKAKAKKEGRKLKIMATKTEVRLYLKPKHKPSTWQKYISSKGGIQAAVDGKNSGDYDKWLAKHK